MARDSGLVTIAAPAYAQHVEGDNGSILHLYPDKAHAQAAHDANAARREAPPSQNLINHGGPVLAAAKVVSIFWGPSWGTNSNPGAVAAHVTGFFANFGSTGEWKTIDQYGAHPTNLTNTAWFDSVNPPNTAVTDGDVQAEVLKYINGHGGVPDDSTVYEVFIPTAFTRSSAATRPAAGRISSSARITATSAAWATTSSTRRCRTRPAAAARRAPASASRRTSTTSPATRPARRPPIRT
jgi:hypothetical protein